MTDRPRALPASRDRPRMIYESEFLLIPTLLHLSFLCILLLLAIMLLYTALSLAGLALAVPFSGSNQRVRAIPKRDDSSINASECASPCEIYFHPVTTTMTVSASPETMDIDGIDHPVTVTFTPLTTSTTLQPAPQTVENSDPAGTPTVAINPVDLGSVTLYGSSRNYNWNVAAQAQLVTQPHPYLLSHGVNPYLLDNNCAFVTMAKLLNMGLHPFVDMVGEMQNADRGIDTDDVQRILRGLQKEQFMLT